MIQIEFQYFDGCPNVEKLENELLDALDNFHGNYNYKKVRISDDESAVKFKFRGSPTLIINGMDFEYLPEPKHPTMNCRIYKNGIPKAEQILERLKSIS